jgi:hypothetical protein
MFHVKQLNLRRSLICLLLMAPAFDEAVVGR